MSFHPIEDEIMLLVEVLKSEIKKWNLDCPWQLCKKEKYIYDMLVFVKYATYVYLKQIHFLCTYLIIMVIIFWFQDITGIERSRARKLKIKIFFLEKTCLKCF